MTKLDSVVEKFAFGLEEPSTTVELSGYIHVLVGGEVNWIG